MIAANRLERIPASISTRSFRIQPVRNSEIMTGDIIVGFNGKGIGSVDELHKQLNERVIGRMVDLECSEKWS